MGLLLLWALSWVVFLLFLTVPPLRRWWKHGQWSDPLFVAGKVVVWFAQMGLAIGLLLVLYIASTR